MTDQEWGDLDALPTNRSGAPRWLWACGGGCLLMVLVSMAAGWGVVSWYNEGTQGEDRWTRLAEILPFDERSEAFELGFGQTVPFWDVEFFLFTSNGHGVLDSSADADAANSEELEEVEELEDLASSEESAPRKRSESLFVVLMYMSGEASDQALPELVGPDDAGQFQMEIQGRELAAFRLDEDGSSESWALTLGSQPTLAVELTLPDAEGRLILLAGRERSHEPVSSEEIAKFLAPFHVGPER
ncbi:MAG: hypothetical protein ACI8QZ_003655 [Chlamydiales bacterium]|jgi:hypothetical protein